MNHALIIKDLATPSLAKALLTLAFTWLNPHVYLDMVGFSEFGADAYAMSAYFVFFFPLGYSLRLLVLIFQKP